MNVIFVGDKAKSFHFCFDSVQCIDRVIKSQHCKLTLENMQNKVYNNNKTVFTIRMDQIS